MENTKLRARHKGARRGHDLAHVIGEGASVGRNRALREAVAISPAVLMAAVLAAAIYVLTVLRAPPYNFGAIAVAASLMALIPPIAAAVLLSLRDQDQPVTTALIVTGTTAAVFVAILSALRVPMSYLAALLSVLPSLVSMLAIMLRLSRAENERVALLDFDGAADVLAALGGGVPVAAGTDLDLGLYDRFLIDARAHYSSDWSRFLLRCYMRGIVVTPWVTFIERRSGRVDIAHFEPADIVLRPGQILYSRLKRATDILAVLIALPFALVLGAICWLYILIRAGRPVLFLQARRGLGGRAFTIVKFRTMREGKHGEGDDARIVPGLRFIRRFRLDEIPQIYNIWRGDMSWIGPRPATLAVAGAAEAVEPKFASRLLVRPGLTGWAQVNTGYASTVSEEIEKLSYDLYYVKNMSLDLDLVVLVRTIRMLVFGGGRGSRGR